MLRGLQSLRLDLHEAIASHAIIVFFLFFLNNGVQLDAGFLYFFEIDIGRGISMMKRF